MRECSNSSGSSDSFFKQFLLFNIIWILSYLQNNPWIYRLISHTIRNTKKICLFICFRTHYKFDKSITVYYLLKHNIVTSNHIVIDKLQNYPIVSKFNSFKIYFLQIRLISYQLTLLILKHRKNSELSLKIYLFCHLNAFFFIITEFGCALFIFANSAFVIVARWTLPTRFPIVAFPLQSPKPADLQTGLRQTPN